MFVDFFSPIPSYVCLYHGEYMAYSCLRTKDSNFEQTRGEACWFITSNMFEETCDPLSWIPSYKGKCVPSIGNI